jgi:hypothetical protein
MTVTNENVNKIYVEGKPRGIVGFVQHQEVRYSMGGDD